MSSSGSDTWLFAGFVVYAIAFTGFIGWRLWSLGRDHPTLR